VRSDATPHGRRGPGPKIEQGADTSALPLTVQWLRRLLPILFLTTVIMLAGRELRAVDWHAFNVSLHNIPTWELLLLQAAALLAVSSMVLYDWSLCRWMAIDIPIKMLLRYSWVANTFNNLVSLSGLAGSGIRYLLLSREGVPSKDAVLYSGILMLSGPVGLAVLVWPTLLFNRDSLDALPIPTSLVYGALTIFALFLPLYLVITGHGRLQEHWLKLARPLGLPERLALIGISTLDWLFATATAWACLGVSGSWLPLFDFVGAFTVAAALGIFSLMPGGLLVFDGALFVGLSSLHASAEAVLAGIVLYRLVYFVLPWFIGVYLGTSLLTSGDDALLANLARRWQENPLLAMLRMPLGLLSSVGVRMLGYLTFLAGVVLLLSAAFPTLGERLAFLRSHVPLVAVEGSHLLSVATAVLLIALARGITDRVYGAYRLAVALLLIGALLSLVKGIDWEEATFLGATAAVLWLRRAQFHRVSYPLISLRNLGWLFALAAVIGGYMLLGAAQHADIDLGDVHIFSFSYRLDAARFLRSLSVAMLVALGVLGWILFRMPGPPISLPTEAELRTAREFLESHGGSGFCHLMFSGDKHLFYSSDNGALIQFGRIHDRLVALGDPVGNAESIERAVQEFRAFADKYDLVPVFYEVMEKHLDVYHDNGFSLFKLGERALVRLSDFTLTGKHRSSLRQSAQRARRAGATVEVLQHPLSDTVWRELKRVSDDWLRSKHAAEKSFSLGAFERNYLSASPIAVVKNADGIVAFANLFPGYGTREEFSVDLIRHCASAPPGTMDLLMTTLMEYAHEQGYRYFDLGLAPLSGVGDVRYARPQEKLARLAFEYGNRFYGYKGLRSFKEKFQPEWRSAYLAYPYLTPLPGLLVDVAALIAGGYWRILFREKASTPAT
jgi:phosphatidylglycerol lysyltransferase